MKISLLVCKPDGTQVMEEKEVPDTWFSSETIETSEQEASPEENSSELSN
ncbi:MAG: hypothetical protein GX488_01100 [Clostridiales bacterium]|nr:hypothetical protein [Clostridiales bacterium]